MLETDMSKAGDHEWICLYHSSSILEPRSASVPASLAEGDSPKVMRMNVAHAVGAEWSFRRMLIHLGSLPFI
jgi:hypothetical protein